ncbi:hypothetical protein SKAU_G00184890 [Synaphobranchus kaupii]|uniref:Uncharacterized protein n=1 Tax=Synaphobranchus kaupii TaxID=118154 RepID=A0A9Q1FCC1_SYNKA|nr:hypothetical protein SKAU_G00184890 [Synaphobranchus kaupii]
MLGANPVRRSNDAPAGVVPCGRSADALGVADGNRSFPLSTTFKGDNGEKGDPKGAFLFAQSAAVERAFAADKNIPAFPLQPALLSGVSRAKKGRGGGLYQAKAKTVCQFKPNPGEPEPLKNRGRETEEE